MYFYSSLHHIPFPRTFLVHWHQCKTIGQKLDKTFQNTIRFGRVSTVVMESEFMACKSNQHLVSLNSNQGSVVIKLWQPPNATLSFFSYPILNQLLHRLASNHRHFQQWVIKWTRRLLIVVVEGTKMLGLEKTNPEKKLPKGKERWWKDDDENGRVIGFYIKKWGKWDREKLVTRSEYNRISKRTEPIF